MMRFSFLMIHLTGLLVRISILVGLLAGLFATGCSTTRSWDGLAGRFGKSKPRPDTLVLDKQSLSKGFQKSRGGFTRKGLKNPEDTNLAFARWKEDMGQYAESKRRYHEVLTANPNCLPARLGIARIECETGRFAQCREILTAAQKQHPYDPAVMLGLGRMYNEREQWDDSVRSFTRAADLAPDDQTVRYELGLALAHAGRVQEALPHLKFAVGESAAFYNIGFMLYEQGQLTEAARWIERTLEAHPDERTRQMVRELIAELDSALPAAQSFSGRASAVVISKRTPTIGRQIRAASANLTTADGFQPPGASQYNSTLTGNTSPLQWSSPRNNLSKWTRSTQAPVPVHAPGYSQLVTDSEATEPQGRRR